MNYYSLEHFILFYFFLLELGPSNSKSFQCSNNFFFYCKYKYYAKYIHLLKPTNNFIGIFRILEALSELNESELERIGIGRIGIEGIEGRIEKKGSPLLLMFLIEHHTT